MHSDKSSVGLQRQTTNRNVPGHYVCTRASGVSARFQQDMRSENNAEKVSLSTSCSNVQLVLSLMLTVLPRTFAASALRRTLGKTSESSRNAVKQLSGLIAMLKISLTLENVGTVAKHRSRAQQSPKQDPGVLTTRRFSQKRNHLFS